MLARSTSGTAARTVRTRGVAQGKGMRLEPRKGRHGRLRPGRSEGRGAPDPGPRSTNTTAHWSTNRSQQHSQRCSPPMLMEMLMHNMLSSFAMAIVTLLGIAAVLGVVLLVAVEIRCLLRINRQLGAPSDEPRYFDDVGSDLDRYR